MEHALLGKSLLVLTAHPDDETFTAGGTIHANTVAGGKTVLLCASLGGRGRAHLDRELTDEELKDVRFEELHQASACLGMHEVHVFDFPDGEISDYKKEILAQWTPLVRDIQPDAILSFGPDGYTGHADHTAISEVAQHLAKTFAIPRFNFSLPTGELEEAFQACLLKKRSHGTYAEAQLSKEVSCICITIAAEKKLEALKHHASQFGGLDPYRIFPRDIAEHFLAHEYFIEASR